MCQGFAYVMRILLFFINTTLEELFNTSDITQFKKSIAELVEQQDYTTLSVLLRRNQNENIPQSDKRFSKHNGKLCNFVKYTNQSNSNSQIQYYDPNSFLSTELQMNNNYILNETDVKKLEPIIIELGHKNDLTMNDIIYKGLNCIII